MDCKVCNKESEVWSSGRILNKYEINYFKCTNCGFVQTEEPYWLEEAYKVPINFSDVGYVKRNIVLSKFTSKLIDKNFKKLGKFLDYGSGYGLFVRLMRDMGYNFYWDDKYCENLFAIGFEADENSKYELLTAFELFEHLDQPIAEFEKMLSLSDSILLSTYLIPENYPKPGEWWYYGDEHGQHISLYSYKTLKFLASKFKLNLISNNKNLHIFSKRKINSIHFKYIDIRQKLKYLSNFSSKKSPTDLDQELLIKKFKSS